jgi:hypothetical protein
MHIILSFNISTVSEHSTSWTRVLPVRVTTKIRISSRCSNVESRKNQFRVSSCYGLIFCVDTKLQNRRRNGVPHSVMISCPAVFRPIRPSRVSIPLVPVICILLHQTMPSKAYHRSDGVRIQHDPYAPGMKEHYGSPGQTDDEGFDPYADSVGPGIYGGKVKRDPSTGQVVIGKQYQNHNPNPGPVYAGGGYTDINRALGAGDAAVAALLDSDPSLVNEISTGRKPHTHRYSMPIDPSPPHLPPCPLPALFPPTAESSVAARSPPPGVGGAGRAGGGRRGDAAPHVRDEPAQPGRDGAPHRARRRHRGGRYLRLPPAAPHGLQQPRGQRRARRVRVRHNCIQQPRGPRRAAPRARTPC